MRSLVDDKLCKKLLDFINVISNAYETFRYSTVETLITIWLSGSINYKNWLTVQTRAWCTLVLQKKDIFV